ncbi:MAG: hypothetical protein ACKO26_04170, partial [Planctomycetota bacterium]
MFRQVFVLLMLASSPLIGRGDVVLQNTTTGTGITTNPNTGTFNIRFNAPVDANLAGIVLYNSSSSLSTFSSLQWQLERAGNIVGSKSFTSATLANGNTIAGNNGTTRNGYFFDFSDSTIANPLQSGTYNLYAVDLNSKVTGWSFSTGSSI